MMLRPLTIDDAMIGTECYRDQGEGDELLVIDGIASPDPIDGEERVRIHGELAPVCIGALTIRA